MSLDDWSKVAAIVGAVSSVIAPTLPPVRKFLFGYEQAPPSRFAPAVLGALGALLVICVFLFLMPTSLNTEPGDQKPAKKNDGDENWTAQSKCRDGMKIVGLYCQIDPGGEGGNLQNSGISADGTAVCTWNGVGKGKVLLAHIVPVCAGIK